jgi:hypothetical protein
MWEIATGHQVGPEVIRPKTWPAYLLRDEDGRNFWLFVHADQEVEVVDVETGNARGRKGRDLLAELERPPAVFPDGQSVQTVLGLNGVTIVQRDPVRPDTASRLWRLSRASTSYQITPDGRRLASLFSDQRVGWLDLASQRLSLPTAGAASEASPYGDGIAANSEGRSCLYASPRRGFLKRFDFPRLLPPAVLGGTVGQSRFAASTTPPVAFDRAAFSPDGSVALLGDVARQ